jgi:hypothetical protein
MAYVPGHKHDLFVSYSRAESAWVDAFRIALEQIIHERLGIAADFWQDVTNIRFGQNWTDEIRNAIKGAAVFVAICSPSYFESEWCAKEYQEFAPDGKADSLMIGNVCRFLKVVKTPDAEEIYKAFYPALQSMEFFNQAKEEYLPGSNEFLLNVRRTASGVAELLRTMRNSKQALYLGSPGTDLEEEWTQLRTQLVDYGYDIRPQQVRLTPALASRVEKELERSLLAIFLLGGVEDGFVKQQIEAAKEMGRRSFLWVHPKKAKQAPAEVLQTLLGETPPGFQTMSQNSIRDFIRDLVELLAKPERPPQTTVDESAGNVVYLLHDGNQAEEAARADRIRTMVCEQKFKVLPERNETLTADLHERLMKHCDGLLLYRGLMPGPDKWLFQNVSQLQFAEKMYDLERPLKAKTLLLADPQQVTGLPNLDVLPYAEPLNAEQLQPFFRKMNQARGARAGS